LLWAIGARAEPGRVQSLREDRREKRRNWDIIDAAPTRYRDLPRPHESEHEGVDSQRVENQYQDIEQVAGMFERHVNEHLREAGEEQVKCASLGIRDAPCRKQSTSILNWYRALKLEARIGKIMVPTLYIWGTEDLALGETAAIQTRQFVTGPLTGPALLEMDDYRSVDQTLRVTSILERRRTT
jgi:pimeloyl-ACP methyl ester carboxylesterase